MDWALWFGGGAACLIVGLLIGYMIGFNLAKDAYQNLLTDRHMRHSADLQSYFGVLRRQVANQLIIRDPTKYVDLYRKILWELEELGEADTARINAELKIISDRYPSVDHFDINGGVGFILYSEFPGDDKLESVYRDLHVYATIVRSAPEVNSLAAKWRPTTSKEELKHLQEYVRELSDTYFRHKIIRSGRALRDFEEFIRPLHKIDGFSDLWHQAVEQTYGPNVKFATKDFIAQEVFLMPELGDGFTFLDDGSYGLTTFFSGDRDKFFVNIYRSDAGFKEQGRIRGSQLTHLPVPYETDDKKALGY
jgi:hypothetical protein